MANTPSTRNYVVPGGDVYFDEFDANGALTGARHLGNAPDFKSNVDLKTLAHTNSKGEKDLEIALAPEITLSVTLDEVEKENLTMAFMAETTAVAQSAADLNTATVTAKKARWFDLGKRAIGVWKLGYDGGTGAIAVGDTLTGETSGATAVVKQVVGDVVSGTLYLASITGTFQNNENLVVATTKAVANGTQVFDTTDLVVSSAGPVFFVKGTDYTVDSANGRLYLTEESTIADADTLTVVFGCSACSYTIIHGFKRETIEGRLTFVAENRNGASPMIHFWRASIKPEKELSWIGSEWQKFTFTATVLKDEANHPDSPFCDVILPSA